MKSTIDLSAAEWVKSSYSAGNGGACVEHAPGVAASTGMVPVRDSKHPQGPALVIPAQGWNAFVSAVGSGAFDAR
jgi:hypothetical protein